MNAVDTNELVYVYDDRDPRKSAIATSILDMLEDGVLLWQVACEFVSASQKLAGIGYARKEAWQNLREIRRLLPMVLPTAGVLDRARMLTLSSPMHYWDAMIYAACLEAGVNRIYSEDLPGRSIESLEVVNPFS